VRISKEYGDTGSIVEFTNEEHDTIKNMIIGMEREHGYDTEKWRESYNSFDNDDYLFASCLIHDISNTFTRMHLNPINQVWREGYHAPPYIRVVMSEEHALKRSEDGYRYVVDDKQLNMGVEGPDEKGKYILKVHRYFFLRFIQFLGEIFDDNQAMVIKPSSENAEEMPWEKGRRVTRDDLLGIGAQCLSTGLDIIGRWYQEKAHSIKEGQSIPLPFPVFWKNGEDNTEEFLGIVEYSDNGLEMPMKKRIFITSGFARHFDTRNDLIADLFMNAFRAVFTHEFAHVINGHGLLGKNDTAYASQRIVRICAEQNADDTAMRILLTELLFERIDGAAHNSILALSYENLKEQWALRIFSFYLILSWAFRKEDRVWRSEVLDDYKMNQGRRHPLYQFRLYNIIRRAAQLLPDIIECKEYANLVTRDGMPIDIGLVVGTLQLAMDYVNSFESSFEASLGEDQRTIMQMLKDSIKMERNSFQSDLSKVPYAPPLYDDSARAEVEAIRQAWPELKRHLEVSGTYARLSDTI